MSESELLEALRAALAGAEGDAEDAGAMTTSDLCAALGWYREKVRVGLRELKRQGRLEVTWVKREALDGKARPFPAYRLKAENG